MAKSPQEQAQTMIDNLPAKTGKSLSQWQTVVAGSGAAKHGEHDGDESADDVGG